MIVSKKDPTTDFREDTDRMIEALTGFTRGDFSARLPVADLDSPIAALHTAINVTGQELERALESERSSSVLLDALHAAQEAYIRGGDVGDLFDRLLRRLLELTSSEYGFIGEALRDSDGAVMGQA